MAGRIGRAAAGRLAVPAPPWSRPVLGGLIATDTVALGLIAVGWYLASGSARGSQVPGVNLAIGALALSAVGHGLWICRARRAVGTYRVRLLPAALVTERAAAVSPVGATDPVAGADMALYHRPACLLVADKAVTRQSRSSHELAGRRPCGVCEP
jgi:hypothetical protein